MEHTVFLCVLPPSEEGKSFPEVLPAPHWLEAILCLLRVAKKLLPRGKQCERLGIPFLHLLPGQLYLICLFALYSLANYLFVLSKLNNTLSPVIYKRRGLQ